MKKSKHIAETIRHSLEKFAKTSVFSRFSEAAFSEKSPWVVIGELTWALEDIGVKGYLTVNHPRPMHISMGSGVSMLTHTLIHNELKNGLIHSEGGFRYKSKQVTVTVIQTGLNAEERKAQQDNTVSIIDLFTSLLEYKQIKPHEKSSLEP